MGDKTRESPILFTGTMVRALLRGVEPKWQTRRLITRANSYRDGVASNAERWAELDWNSPNIFVDGGPSPAGNPGPYLHVPDRDGDCSHRIYPRRQPGDRLWVKETFHHESGEILVRYKATHDDLHPVKRWKPSIFMPRWASRVTLAITKLRAERLQDITEEDAIAEGINGELCALYTTSAPSRHTLLPAAVHAYAGLWDVINGEGSWASNPWLWVHEFKRI